MLVMSGSDRDRLQETFQRSGARPQFFAQRWPKSNEDSPELGQQVADVAGCHASQSLSSRRQLRALAAAEW